MGTTRCGGGAGRLDEATLPGSLRVTTGGSGEGGSCGPFLPRRAVSLCGGGGILTQSSMNRLRISSTCDGALEATGGSDRDLVVPVSVDMVVPTCELGGECQLPQSLE